MEIDKRYLKKIKNDVSTSGILLIEFYEHFDPFIFEYIQLNFFEIVTSIGLNFITTRFISEKLYTNLLNKIDELYLIVSDRDKSLIALNTILKSVLKSVEEKNNVNEYYELNIPVVNLLIGIEVIFKKYLLLNKKCI